MNQSVARCSNRKETLFMVSKEIKKPKHGKQPNQKFKAYLVYEFLKRKTDEEAAANVDDIIDYLNTRGIDAERRSIYRDVEDINKLFYLLENEEADMKEASAFFDKENKTDEQLEEMEEEKTIVYDKSKKGFYVQRRLNYENDIRLLAECVYATKFIDESSSKLLIDTVCDLVSENQADKIRHNVFLADRVKTDNKSVYHNVDVINEALNNRVNDVKRPVKVTFRYQTYNINDLKEKAYRRGGALYKVSPFQLVINDGNYYMLGFDDKVKKIMTYRVDRMVQVEKIDEPREGTKEYKEIDLTSVFNMFKGEKKTVQLKCINPLLDTMIERFGTKKANYKKADEDHFVVTAEVEISDQFFGWILGFGKKVILQNPPSIVKQFKEYLNGIKKLY